MRHPILATMTLLAAASLTACASMAPPVAPAAPGLPQQFSTRVVEPGTFSGSFATTASDLRWADFFTDARLRQVITLAIENNRDLRVALLNIEKAQATYQIQRSQSFPAVSAQAGASQARTPASLSSTGQALTTHQYSATLGISAYELDLFGRVRSLNEQALQQYLSTEQSSLATRISLVANVATAYLTWSADQERLDVARETLAAQARYAELVDTRYQRGYASELDLRQALASKESARADVARYASQVVKDANAVALLIGTEVPERLSPPRLDLWGIELPDVPAGLPSDLMLRRPDVRQAEHQLRAATASIGAARAAFYPRISLTTAAGASSAELGSLFKGGAGTWSFSPQLSLPIFDAGANRARLGSAEADQKIALADYEHSIQTAFREVSDALADRAVVDEELDAQERQAEHSGEALRLSQARYERGVDSFLPVLDAQRTAYAAQQSLVTARLSALSSRITLYKTLGGGWQ